MRHGPFISVPTVALSTDAIARASATASMGGGTPTLSGDNWTPARDGSDFILSGEWNLPLNRWIRLVGSAFNSAGLGPNYGAAAGYSPAGSGPIAAHYNAFTGAAFDSTNGRFYHFGGGHGDGAFNGLTCFDVLKGKHRITIPPTHQSMYPPGYATPNLYGYKTPCYPTTNVDGSGTRHRNFFPSGESTPGDNKPASHHTWCGLVFVPGINEVISPYGAPWGISPSGSWYHAMVDSGAWRVGPQVLDGGQLDWSRRDGIAFQCHYLPSTGLVYLTSEAGQISGSPNASDADYVAIIYNPVTRTEVGTVFIGQTGASTNSCMEGDVFWQFAGLYGANLAVHVSKTNLNTQTNILNNQVCTGRRPEFFSTGGDGMNPVQHATDIDKILMWCTVSRSGEAQAGEMLEFNRSTLAFSLFTVGGTPPAAPANMNSKMRYFPAKKVMVFNTAVDQDVYFIKLAA